MPFDVPDSKTAIVMAGVPATNKSLLHATRFAVGDPAALIVTRRSGGLHRLLILRDIEMDRARKHAQADQVACPGEFAPVGGLSGDRETATAQAAAQAVAAAGCHRVIADRTLGLIFVDQLQQQGIAVEYDADLGVVDRRAKDAQEIEHLRRAQETTERAVQLACELVAQSDADASGALQHEGQPLTAERVRLAIDTFLMQHNFANAGSIVAPGTQGADCHEYGSGAIHTGQSVIIDIFPCDRASGYHGDCTRTIVHGDVPDELLRMHMAVCQAKAAAIAAVRPGATGDQVHRATIDVIEAKGYAVGLPTAEHPITMTHGTGHGVGLAIHESPLLDFKGPPLLEGDALTVEPGLYKMQLGGVRLEDMVIVTAGGCENLNTVHEGLGWR